ncbi:MAG: hypothetical protein JO270_26800 [Acidobacteriaceae bacterium]|nr:hypothetical protein [Acidobacteriaceae bacterium]MBV8569143.1 hypothetical protein [Acidobacteriaceae bacterium]
MKHTLKLGTKPWLLAGVLAGSLLSLPVSGQTSAPAAAAPTNPAGNAAAKSPTPGTPFHFQENRLPRRAEMYYQGFWGIDSLGVKEVESGELIRFSWRVVDAQKAKAIHDKKSEPVLVDPRAGVKLVVPSLEKVGQLRQSSTPIEGKSYWMAFSNKGHVVKPGDRVSVVIGLFKAEGLVVQ